jgi:rare lipoprotein A
MGRSLSSVGLFAARAALVAGVALTLANCSASSKVDPRYGVTASPRVMADGEEIPKGTGKYRVGKPYVVAGVTYIPQEDPNYRADGMASWYGDAFHGRLTANGEIFDMKSITAAHPTLPLPSYVRVTNLANRKSLIVRVNDRGPYHANRVIDVSSRAADLLGFKHHGVARVRVEYVAPAKIEGSDDVQLAATLRQDGTPAPAPSHVMIAQQRPFIQQAEAPAVVQRRQVANANNAWQFGPQAPAAAPANPQRIAPNVQPVRAGFNAAPPMPATSFSPASISGRGLY